MGLCDLAKHPWIDIGREQADDGDDQQQLKQGEAVDRSAPM